MACRQTNLNVVFTSAGTDRQDFSSGRGAKSNPSKKPKPKQKEV